MRVSWENTKTILVACGTPEGQEGFSRQQDLPITRITNKTQRTGGPISSVNPTITVNKEKKALDGMSVFQGGEYEAYYELGWWSTGLWGGGPWKDLALGVLGGGDRKKEFL